MILKDVDYNGVKIKSLIELGKGDVTVSSFIVKNEVCAGISFGDGDGVFEIGHDHKDKIGEKISVIKPKIVIELTDSKSCDVVIQALERAKEYILLMQQKK